MVDKKRGGVTNSLGVEINCLGIPALLELLVALILKLFSSLIISHY